MAKTSDDIRTMSNARTSMSVPSSTFFCEKVKDKIRLNRNETFLKRRRLRRENIATVKKIRQLETYLNLEDKG